MRPFPDDSRYLNWRPTIIGDKTTKQPWDVARGHAINAYDPTNHHGWAEVTKRDKLHVGRAIYAPEFAVDFDNQLQVEAYFKHLTPSYAEYSPSKHPFKIHVWYVCSEHHKLPKQGGKNFEAYSRDRFFTVTHDHVAGTPDSITCLNATEAMKIFTLSGYEPKSAGVMQHDTGSSEDAGYWAPPALEHALKSMKIQFAPRGDGSFTVACPGNHGWKDGAKHSYEENFPPVNTKVWIHNGWVYFRCLHAHCQSPLKGWWELCDHYGTTSDELWEAWSESGEWNSHAKRVARSFGMLLE